MDKIHHTILCYNQVDQNIKNLAEKASSDGVLRIAADLSYAITLCPRCGQAEVTYNGFKQVAVRLPRVRERTTLLVLRKQRFRFKKCGMLTQTPLVRKQHQTSENSLHAIDLSLIEDRTMSSIASQYNASTNTISWRLTLRKRGPANVQWIT